MKASVIIAVYNGEAYLEHTLESLVTQTTEDFEVIIVDDGSTDKTGEIAEKYCAEYVGFDCVKVPHGGVYAARNAGIEKARGEYFIFLDCGDYYPDGAIEGMIQTAAETGADVITGRCYRFGDIEYEYDPDVDDLAVRTKIDPLTPSLLGCAELGCRAVKKKLFDLYDLRFDETKTAHDERRFLSQACFLSKLTTGCPEFIMEKRVEHVTKGFSQFEAPTAENLDSLMRSHREINAMGVREILKRSGGVEGDEEFTQTLIYETISSIFNLFYRRLWYMSDDTLGMMRECLDELGKSTVKSTVQKLGEKHKDLRIPVIYVSKESAAEEPLFSIMFNVGEGDYSAFLRSMYAQTYPFFELIVRKSAFDSFPDEFKAMKNIVVFDDKTYHYEARKYAHSRYVIETRNASPVDRRVLRELCLMKAPSFLIKRFFDGKRTQLGARKTLKDKGLVLKDRENK